MVLPFDLAIDALSHPILLVGIDSRIQYANRAMLAYVALVTGKQWDRDHVSSRAALGFAPATWAGGA